MAIGVPHPPRVESRAPYTSRGFGIGSLRTDVVFETGMLRALSVTQSFWKRLFCNVLGRSQGRVRSRQRQRAQLELFERQYERLIDLLCSAAHEGIHPELEGAYKVTRLWMVEHYPYIEPHVRSYWQASEAEEPDPFRELFSSESLHDAINIDTGIDDIMRSRCALDKYRTDITPSCA